MNRLINLIIMGFVFAYTSAAQADSSDLSCLSAEQKFDFEQKNKELITELNNLLKPSDEQAKIKNNIDNLAQVMLKNCNPFNKDEEQQFEICKKAQLDFNTQLRTLEILMSKGNPPKGEVILVQTQQNVEKSINLRNQYPMCQ